MGELSPAHLIIVLVIALVVLGPGKLPEVGAGLGKAVRGFRSAASEAREAINLDPAPVPAAPTQGAAQVAAQAVAPAAPLADESAAGG